MPPQTLSEANVLEALRVCFDPELPVNIVDLGLVNSICVTRDEDAPGLEPRYLIEVNLTLRARSDEREAMLTGQVTNRLAGMQEVSRSHVNLVWDPPWTADRMTEAARQQLGLDRPPAQGLVTIKL